MRKHPDAGSSAVSLFVAATMILSLAVAGFAAQRSADPSRIVDFSAGSVVRS